MARDALVLARENDPVLRPMMSSMLSGPPEFEADVNAKRIYWAKLK